MVLRVVIALALAAVVAALVYALTSGHVFLFPFLLIVGFPMIALFRRPPRQPPPRPPFPPARISPN